MPPPRTHIPSGAARWMPSTVAVTEIIFYVVISGYRISARGIRHVSNNVFAFRSVADPGENLTGLCTPISGVVGVVGVVSMKVEFMR